MEIAEGCVATVHFTLLDQQGGQITTTHGHDPLVYLHGTGSIVPGLEQALAGRNPGDEFEVEIAPDQGFGKRHDALVQDLPMGMLGDGASVPAVGARLKAQTARGPLDVVVTAVHGTTITVDGNHPLAGRPFRARVEVVDVRPATAEETESGLG